MLEKSKEKNIKRQEKLGVSYDNKMAEVAKTKGLNYNNSSADDYDNTSYKKNSNKKSKQTGSDYKRSNVSYSSKSIAANANLLSNRSSAKKEVKNEDTVNSDSNDKSES